MMLRILDSTLREGEQTPYVSFTIEEKLNIARMLDRIGVDMIEAGDPSVSASVYDSIKQICSLGLRAEIVAHSLAIKKRNRQGQGVRSGQGRRILSDFKDTS
jgi:2-isopropylmalate synthase